MGERFAEKSINLLNKILSLENDGTAPEVTDLNAADVSYAKEKEIPDLKHPFISTAPKDRGDGIPVGQLDKNAEMVIRHFAKEIENGTHGEVDSLLSSKEGKLVFESYYRRGRANYPHYQMSITKSYTAMALGRAIQHRFPVYYQYFALPSFRYRNAEIRNHNALLGNVKGVDGIKTGYTRDSGFNLLSNVRRGNKHLIAVVFGGKTSKKRNAAMRAILNKSMRKAIARLPRKQRPDGRASQVTIVPFYDRSGLIHETLGTLSTALMLEILITVIVVILMVRHLRSGLMVAGLLPLAVLLCFIGMKLFDVEAKIVALSGIAIAIGTMVDMGVILTENILRRIAQTDRESAASGQPAPSRREVIFHAASEVGGAVVTAVATTIISFLPVFTLVAAEGKLFRPLAWTKSFALLAALLIALLVIPPVAHLLLRRRAHHGL